MARMLAKIAKSIAIKDEKSKIFSYSKMRILLLSMRFSPVSILRAHEERFLAFSF